MNNLLDQLQDIEGIDPFPWWSLPIGFWILIGIAFLLLCGIGYYIIKKIAFRRSWKYDALKKLDILEQNLSEENTRETLISLSEYLRRIALYHAERKECAGLIGDSWLKWLKEKDPKKFDWETKGRLLIDIPYVSKFNEPISKDLSKELIQAVKNWVI